MDTATAKQLLKRHQDLLWFFIVCTIWNHFYVIYGNYDIVPHSIEAVKMAKGEQSYPPNFLYYLLLRIFSPETSIAMYTRVAVVLLAFAHTAKYGLSQWILYKLLEPYRIEKINQWVKWLALAAFFTFAIPDPHGLLRLNHYYIGKIVPHVWHNSTTILLFPFALLLFWKQWQVLQSRMETKSSDLWQLALLITLNAIIKPSFLLVYLPVTGLFLLEKHRMQVGELLKNSLPLIWGGTLVLMLSILIYQYQVGSFQPENSSIAFGRPFEFFRKYSEPDKYVPIAFGFSLAGPALFFLLYPTYLKEPFVKYVVSLFAAAFFIACFLVEAGPRRLDGNLVWQLIICDFLLMLTTAFLLMKQYCKQEGKWSLRLRLSTAVYGLHLASGLLYPLRIIWVKDPL